LFLDFYVWNTKSSFESTFPECIIFNLWIFISRIKGIFEILKNMLGAGIKILGVGRICLLEVKKIHFEMGVS